MRKQGLKIEWLKKVNGERDISKQMAMVWKAGTRILIIKGGFASNQLGLGRNTILPNLITLERVRIFEGNPECITQNKEPHI